MADESIVAKIFESARNFAQKLNVKADEAERAMKAQFYKPAYEEAYRKARMSYPENWAKEIAHEKANKAANLTFNLIRGAADTTGTIKIIGASAKPLFHASQKIFEKFSPEKVGYGTLGKGGYLTNQERLARSFGENVMKFKVPKGKYWELTNQKASYKDLKNLAKEIGVEKELSEQISSKAFKAVHGPKLNPGLQMSVMSSAIRKKVASGKVQGVTPDDVIGTGATDLIQRKLQEKGFLGIMAPRNDVWKGAKEVLVFDVNKLQNIK